MPREGRLPGAEDPDPRIVLHVDMDAFYANCERRKEPALEGEPVVVGMGYKPGETIGAVATASYEAREFGVESAQPISEALERLPRAAADPAETDETDVGFYRSVDHEYYESVAAEVKAILHDLADAVREVSIDEAYLDVTDRTAWDRAGDGDRTLAEGFARHVKQRIEREVGVPASVGVAPNMSTAKVASDADKPDGLVVVPPGSVAEFLAPLPTADVHGVGPVTEETLAELGIETAGDLAAADRDRLAEALGERGPELSRRAAGDDDREVTPTGLPKSLSRESSLPATADGETKRETVSALAADVARRAHERGCLYRTIGIKAVEPPFEVNTRARSLPGPVDDPDLVESVALDLLDEFADDRVRKLGVRVSNLSFSTADQARLDGWDGAAADGPADGDATGEAGSAARGDAATDSRGADGQAALSDFDRAGDRGNEARRAADGAGDEAGESTAPETDDDGAVTLRDFETPAGGDDPSDDRDGR